MSGPKVIKNVRMGNIHQRGGGGGRGISTREAGAIDKVKKVLCSALLCRFLVVGRKKKTGKIEEPKRFPSSFKQASLSLLAGSTFNFTI